ncbi:IclR family transcriptional regulator [Paracoccus sp. (in: a-proteobacteria)]|uniref:IclR family transcriptional regulator n=1 Tax=Paracoccus sp. TaxID=267 RepID=UPI003A87B29A
MDSTLLKGLQVLERVVADDAPVGVSALARTLDLPKSNVHRTLTSLREAGYLLYDADQRKYFPSLKLAQMGSRVATNFPLRAAVLPALQRLVQQTGESAHFVCREQNGVVFLANALPPVRIASVIPDNLSLRWDDSAFGIALASALPPQALAEMNGGDVPDAPLQSRLDKARAAGHAKMPRHDTRRIFEIAVPVRSDWETVIGAIGITGPAIRFDEAALTEQIARISAAARTVAESVAGTAGRKEAR